MRIITYLSFCLFYSLSAASIHENASQHNSPHTLEIHQQNHMTNERWDQFQDEIQWFLEYTNPAQMMDERFSSTKEKEKEDQEAYLKEKWEYEYTALVRNIHSMQDGFLEFREKFASALASNFGEGQAASSMYSLTGFELTKWYTEYVEENLFPPNWRDLYEQFIRQRNNIKSEG